MTALRAFLRLAARLADAVLATPPTSWEYRSWDPDARRPDPRPVGAARHDSPGLDRRLPLTAEPRRYPRSTSP